MTPIESFLTEEYLAAVNELVPKVGPMGAYAIGVISAAYWQHGYTPSREALELAALCPSMEAAAAFAADSIAAWLELGEV